MAKQGKCEKVCWWTKAGNIIDYVIPFTPSKFATIKDKKED